MFIDINHLDQSYESTQVYIPSQGVTAVTRPSLQLMVPLSDAVRNLAEPQQTWDETQVGVIKLCMYIYIYHIYVYIYIYIS